MKQVRKTKIICTLGPSTDGDGVVKELVKEGMDAARFNFSHGSYEEHKKRFEQVVAVREELNLPITTILDTKGPEIRLGQIKEGTNLVNDQLFMLTTDEIIGDNIRASVSFKELANDVRRGVHILIDDGLIDMEVEKIQGNDIVCRVLNGGPISTKKGVNVPDTELSMEYLSAMDKSDLLFGIETGFDYVAASFVRKASDVLDIRQLLDENGGQGMGIIAKIENAQGVDNIDKIIEVADGVMVARGDMGVEIPMEEVPIIQKMIIKKVYSAGKVVITATQMLDSMIKNPRPTRAEVTDVANAIYDGTSVIMLSGETAAGAYPVEAVVTMAKIAKRTESDIDYAKRFKKLDPLENPDITTAISHATCMTSIDLKAEAILTVTKTGFTARQVSKFRPNCKIIAFATTGSACRKMNLVWGVTPIPFQESDNMEELVVTAAKQARKYQLVEKGNTVVMTAGMPLGVAGNTNLLRVHVVNE